MRDNHHGDYHFVDYDGDSRRRRLFNRARHLLAHDHHHADAALLDTGAVGIRATKISLVILGATALIQAGIVVISGSVALLSDTLHNVTDAFTAIPLWIAFSVGRRAPTRRYTYGLNRAEDLAGLAIVAAIAISGALVIRESVYRLFEPRMLDHIPWVIAAGFIGGFGNELVARYRIRVGTAISSQALIADGHHARTDALTSLAVVAAGIGAAVNAPWVDPVAGLVVAVPILWLLAKSARVMLRRLSDGVEPETVDEAREAILAVDGVDGVEDVRVRWHGHQIRVTASVAVDPDLSVTQGHDIAHEVEHALHHQFTASIVATIHIEPRDQADRHEIVSHHARP